MSTQFTRRGVLLGGLVVAGGAVCTGVLGAGQAWALDTPSIIGCDDWGARARAAPIKVHNRRPAKILVHHTATAERADLSRTQAERLARNIQNYHLDRSAGPTAASTSRSAAAATCWRAATAAWRCCAAGGAWSRARTAPGRTSSRSASRTRAPTPRPSRPPSSGTGCARCAPTSASSTGCAPPRSTGTATSRTPPARATRCTRCCPSCAPRWPRCSATDGTLGEAGTEAWPLLRVADRGCGRAGRAAPAARRRSHRGGAGRTVRPAHRRRRPPVPAVNGTEQVNGMIGGESWPLLAVADRHGVDPGDRPGAAGAQLGLGADRPGHGHLAAPAGPGGGSRRGR